MRLPSNVFTANDDNERDAVCDSWELNGIPYKQFGLESSMPINLPCPGCTGISTTTANGNPVNLLDIAAINAGTQDANNLNATVGLRDVYIEIDAMKFIAPDMEAINDVIALYADAPRSPWATGPIQLHIWMNQGNRPAATDALPFVGTIAVWNDGDKIFVDDYNGIKAENVGTKDKTTSFITKGAPFNPDGQLKLRVENIANGEYTLFVQNYKITTPNDPNSLPIPNKSKGNVFFVVQIAGIADGALTNDVTLGNSAFASIENTNTGLGCLQMSTAPLFQYQRGGLSGATKLYFFQSYGTVCKLTGQTMGEIRVPFTIQDDKTKVPPGCAGKLPTQFCDTDPVIFSEFPKIENRLYEDAFAQVYRYVEWVFSIGGPSGEAELRGNDMVISLKNFGTSQVTGFQTGTRHAQAGTFAHELIHWFNGLHGGPKYLITDPSQTTLGDTAVNCKVYDGVDKYTRQLPTSLGGYLDLLTVAPGGPHDDVDPTSEWQLSYSDGSHGYNVKELEKDGTFGHIFDLTTRGSSPLPGGLTELDDGGSSLGLDESLTAGLSGTPYTMVWSTAGSSTHGHNIHKHLSDSSGPIAGAGESNTDSNRVFSVGNIDWDDDQSIDGSNVSVNLNNFAGIGGCASGLDTESFDYDAFWHFDYDFRQGVSGQFDGITQFNVEGGENEWWRSIADTGVFDGLHYDCQLTKVGDILMLQ